LPLSKRKVEKAIKTAERFIKGPGTVLLVDDEDVIHEVGQDLLEAMGYRVLIARDGKEAIEILNRGCDGFTQKPFKMKELSQAIRNVFCRE
jgi:CheY-like chemotaxis protein